MDRVKQEWNRLLSRVRKKGPFDTATHVSKLAGKGYPLGLSVRFIEYLMKRGEYDDAGRVIVAVEKSGSEHPLLAELHSSWLWCTGKKRAAIRYARMSADRWRRPYLFSHLAALHGLSGHEKAERRFFAMAHQEDSSKKPTTAKSSKNRSARKK